MLDKWISDEAKPRTDKDGVNYHDVHAMTFHIGKEICQLLPCFHTLTGSDFTNPLPSHSKIKVFKKMLKTPNSHKLLLSLLCEPNIVDKVTLIYTLYIIDLKKNLWENYVTICSKQKRTPTR